jgi:hypothetical protein
VELYSQPPPAAAATPETATINEPPPPPTWPPPPDFQANLVDQYDEDWAHSPNLCPPSPERAELDALDTTPVFAVGEVRTTAPAAPGPPSAGSSSQPMATEYWP